MAVPAEPYKDPDYLRHAYHTLGQTQEEIAQVCGVSRQTIIKWMRKLEVPTNGQSPYTDEELIEAASECIDELGHFPTNEELYNIKGMYHGTIYRHFGSWRSFMKLVEERTDWGLGVAKKRRDGPSSREKVESSISELEQATMRVCPRCQSKSAYEKSGRVICKSCGSYTAVSTD